MEEMQQHQGEWFFLHELNVDKVFSTIQRADYLILYYIKVEQETHPGEKLYLADLAAAMGVRMTELSKGIEKLQDNGFVAWKTDRAAFAKYLPHCRMPVCYNGDITTPAQLKALEAEFPNLSGIMVGRGIIADPALLRQAVGGAPASKEELRGYLDELYHGYTEAFGMASCAVSRMKAHWHYLIQRFEGSEAFEKQLRKAREGWEYEVVVNQLFTLPLL